MSVALDLDQSLLVETRPISRSTLFRKYDVPGPRYTSYPTILHWNDPPTSEEWLKSISDSVTLTERHGMGAAIYVHVPFCRSLCTYCGCNSRITSSTSIGGHYVKTVLREWELYRQRLANSDPILISELHLGGGTPTFLTADELDQLIIGLLNESKRAADAEFSIESDPRVTTPEHLETLYRLGFRRLSLGIQDFDPVVQHAVNRLQSEELVGTVTEQARKIGFESINYDLIYGLPFQTKRSIELTIEAVLRLRPDRIAFYGYAHVPWVKAGQRHFTERDLPFGDEKRGLYELGRQSLGRAGYSEIGMDHFALETDSLWEACRRGTLHRNFMGYTSRLVSPLIGLGVSAISDTWDQFAQNEKDIESYEKRVEAGEIPLMRGHKLSQEDLVLRRHILKLMTRFKTTWTASEWYVPFLESVPMRLSELERDGLVRLTQTSCEVTDDGRPFLRNICMAFDAHVAREAPGKNLFSRTI